MSIDYSALGKRVREFRRKMGITQAQLGELSGVEASNISHIERGATKVSLPTLVKLANVLGVSLDELLYDSLENTAEISVKELNEILGDCTNKELKAIVQIVKVIKENLRR